MNSCLPDDVRALLVCPGCRGPLQDGTESDVLSCPRCRIEYPIRFGIPVLLPPELQNLATDDAREVSHKALQMAHSDREAEDEFAVTRPRGAPALYGRLMQDKFRRSIIGFEHILPGSRALVICGGAGMDAELLVNAGARVILSDISLGVILKAGERARRFGLDFSLVVADAEALPFPDASIDVVYVHDGLHHLEQPALGLSEMARVARRAVSISEPARSLATKVAVRLGLAEVIEEAGNKVMRLTIAEIVGELAKQEFQAIRPHRYGMFYRHWPGYPMRLLSRPVVLPLVLAMLAVANQILGRYGNKLAVQAIRIDTTATGIPLEREVSRRAPIDRPAHKQPVGESVARVATSVSPVIAEPCTPATLEEQQHQVGELRRHERPQGNT